jgi:seryl-tRNA synthetase
MIDINIIRKDPKKIKEVVRKRGNPEKANIDQWLILDEKRRELLTKQSELNSQRNQISYAGNDKNIEGSLLREKAQELRRESDEIDQQIKEITVQWQEIIDWIPNIPSDDMPEGEGEKDNIVLRAWTPENGYINEAEGQKARGFTEKYMPKFPVHADSQNFTPKNHLDLGTALGVIDKEQAAKVSGTRFTYLIGDIVILQYAIQQFMMNELIKRGFTPIVPPLLVKDRALYGSSHFPEHIEQVYAIENDNVEDGNQLYLLGSTETSNFAYCMDKLLDEKDLPLKLVAYAPAFRSEVGSWGKDTKGIKRLHQFDKIEMDVICTPEQSNTIFDELLGINEWMMQQLELPYQLAFKCTGDAGYFASAKQVDPEVWLAGQGEFMEVMTDTHATDYQARSLNIKFKNAKGEKVYAHTVNDTGVEMGRILIAILDHYQQSDGSVKVPNVLVGFMGKEFIRKVS